MQVILLTTLFSVLFAALFLLLFVRTRQHTGGCADQDALLPFSDEAGPSSSFQSTKPNSTTTTSSNHEQR